MEWFFYAAAILAMPLGALVISAMVTRDSRRIARKATHHSTR